MAAYFTALRFLALEDRSPPTALVWDGWFELGVGLESLHPVFPGPLLLLLLPGPSGSVADRMVRRRLGVVDALGADGPGDGGSGRVSSSGPFGSLKSLRLLLLLPLLVLL